MILYKNWLKISIILLGILLFTVGLINYYIDPLLCFSHANRFNSKVIDFDERQQKTDDISFKNFNYNALIIGSSRTTFIDQNSFKPLKAYNYACKSMRPSEYISYINYAKARNKKNFDYIIIGFDFFGTNANFNTEKYENVKSPKYYLNNITNPLYRLKTILSFDCLKLSIKTIILNLQKSSVNMDYYYRQDNIKIAHKRSLKDFKSDLNSQLKKYDEQVYKNYIYDKSINNILSKLKKENPKTKFLIYTTPVSLPLFKLMVKDNRFNDYCQWLRDLTRINGNVYNFMDLNSITNNYDKYFMDAHHLYPETAGLIGKRIIAKDNLINDFGFKLTPYNIENYIKNLNASIKASSYKDFNNLELILEGKKQ